MEKKSLGKEETTWLIKEEALRIGFSFIGMSKAEKLDDGAARLESWLKKGYHGKMQYMANHFDLRTDPALLVPGARSVISLLYNYYNNQTPLNKSEPKIAQYALGEDYHFVVREKLHELLHFIKEFNGDVNARVFVDSGPVLERTWAAKAGLGWVGKNSMLINKEHGSFFFLAEIILDLPLIYDSPIADYCGTCTACIDACPTEAILPDKVVDASKCISYFTIELKDEIPEEVKGKFDGWMFGCDICQDVCPWNRFSQQHNELRFLPSQQLLDMKKNDWEELTEEVFEKVFKDSPLKRPRFEGIKRNVGFLSKV